MATKRVKLKDKSPDFADDRKPRGRVRACDMPGCKNPGEHRAPKDRGLREYYHFCFEHVQEYNKAWDFFEGMSQIDIEAHIRNAMFGERPTWIYTAAPGWEESLRAKAQGFRDFGAEEGPKRESPKPAGDLTPEREALGIMGLEPPVTFAKIKERYRTLMKQHHPDHNQGSRESEEIVKRVNTAYTILKAAHEKYETLK